MSSEAHRYSSVWMVGVFLLAMVMVIAMACGESTPTPEPTATSTPQPTPTATVAPTPIPTDVPSQYPLTITGTDEEAVTLNQAPERIVAIDGAAVEILFAIGQGQRIIGTHDFVSYPPEVEEIERVGGAFALDFEKIASLDPDLIFIFFDSPLEDLKRLGAPVIFLDSPSTLQGVADRIRLWGEIVDAGEAAEAAAGEFEDAIEAVMSKIEGVTQGPRVFHDEAPGLWTTGADSLAAEIYRALKAENIFAEVSGYAQASAEELVARDPEFIISVYEEGPESFTSDPAFQSVSAVTSDQVFAIEGALLSVSGPRMVQGLETLAQILYPELFQ